jgi:UDPglucose 6-dehydrogenase
MKLAVFGLGKLGSVLASVYSDAGHEVVGVDLDEELVNSINSGLAPFEEPQLQELISGSKSRLSATVNLDEALVDAEASYLILPTPSDENGVFTNKYLISVLSGIGTYLKGRANQHTIIICSTVMPGSCDGEIKECIERSSGKKVGEQIGLVYSPEFIALGSIVKDMHFPDLVLIGESDKRSGDIAEKNALSVAKNSPRVERMNLVNAELTKISVNTFVTTKISFANMISEICDKLPGADVDIVTQAVGADSRIGVKYLKGALGYGGPCFPRDNIALTQLAESFGVDASIARATDTINDRQVKRIISVIKSHELLNKRVTILGLAYKPDTPVVERSQGIDIANELLHLGYKVCVFDPQALTNELETLNSNAIKANNIDDSIKNSECVVIATPWSEFKQIPVSKLAGKIVLDPWGVLPAEFNAIRLGKTPLGSKVK